MLGAFQSQRDTQWATVYSSKLERLKARVGKRSCTTPNPKNNKAETFHPFLFLKQNTEHTADTAETGAGQPGASFLRPSQT